MLLIRKYFFLLVCLMVLLPFVSYAQVKGKATRPAFYFQLSGIDARFGVRQPFIMPASDTNLAELFLMLDDKFQVPGKMQDIKLTGPALLGVRMKHVDYGLSLGNIISYSRQFPVWHPADSSEVMVIAAGITPNNYKDYRYHVVMDDTIELVSWTPVTNLQQMNGAPQPCAMLGNYRYPGHQLLVELMNTRDYSLRDGVGIDWKKKRKPVITQIILDRGYDYFNTDRNPRSIKYMLPSLLNDPPGKRSFRFPADTIQNIHFEFAPHDAIPYELLLQRITDNDTQKVLDADITINEYWLDGQFFRQTGKYEALIYFSYYSDELDKHKDEIVRFSFEIYDPVRKTLLFKLMPALLGLLVVIVVVMSIHYRLNKRQLAQAALQKKISQLQLKSVRSQLNPHFLFNALTSIQNLVNKNDVEGANAYLSKFAGLTRTILASSEEELISLEDELAMQHTYLQMEQLRYPFHYTISVEDSINRANTEIPHMLLQPFVENAVKHGAASMKEKGKVDIIVSKENKSLVITVCDNGPGFDPVLRADGNTHMGLKLSADRIRLLNESYRSEVITLNVQSSAAGTSIVLQLKDWLP
jgi:two-component system LytT family sensor kinase